MTTTATTVKGNFVRLAHMSIAQFAAAVKGGK